MDRLLISLLVVFMLGRESGAAFLQLPALTALGDVSYSLYLVHWPVFRLYAYRFPDFEPDCVGE